MNKKGGSVFNHETPEKREKGGRRGLGVPELKAFGRLFQLLGQGATEVGGLG